jgi:hypothetical protein
MKRNTGLQINMNETRAGCLKLPEDEQVWDVQENVTEAAAGSAAFFRRIYFFGDRSVLCLNLLIKKNLAL